MLSPWITAAVAQKMYGIPVGELARAENSSQSVAEFDQQYYSPSDVTKFCHLMDIPEPPIVLVGPNTPSLPGGESTLDIEWILATGAHLLNYQIWL